MAIIKEGFVNLVDNGRINGKDFDKAIKEYGKEATMVALDELRESAESINRGWEIETVEHNNFEITDDLKFRYKNNRGVEKERDISSYAFQQLCTRMGIPSNYLIKCADAGKTDLILDNFREWSKDYRGSLSIMSNSRDGQDKTTRAVMSTSFERFDYGKILSNLVHTVDFDRWCLVQSHLSEDMMVLRFVDSKSPIYTDENSENYVMATLRTSDVGKAGLHINLSSYRRVCTNGMLVSGKIGNLYSQTHSGKEMRKSKIVEFANAFDKAGEYGSLLADSMEQCRKEKLTSRELELWFEKAKRDNKLSKDSMLKLETLVGNTYDTSVWGVANGVTELAQEFTLDTRLTMETWAGNTLARHI